MTSGATAPNRRLLSILLDVRFLTLAMFAVALAFYCYTLQPSLSWGDGTRLQREVITSESFILTELVDVQFAPDPYPFARLGVAAWDHPLYVVIGHTLVRLLPHMNHLWLVNFVSAFFGAAALAAFFWLCYANTHSRIPSAYASLALGVSHTFWFHAATPEVYTLFAFLLLLTLVLYDHYLRTGHTRALIGATLTLGLGVANHLLAFLALPALALQFWLAGKDRRMDWLKLRTLISVALAFLIGFSLYLIQLARMLRTFSLSTVMGPAIGTTFLRGLLETPPQLFLVSLLTYMGYVIFQFGPLGVFLGVYGFWKGRQQFPSLWTVAIAFFIVYGSFGILYRVSDQFAFFLGSYLFWAMAIAIGATQVAAKLSEQRRQWMTAALALSVIAAPFLYGAIPGIARSLGATDQTMGIPQIGTGVRDGLNFYINPNKHGDDSADRFGSQTMESLPRDSVVIAQWYTDTDEYFVLRYFAIVEGLRPDVTLVGWPREEPIDFDSSLAVMLVAEELSQNHPVYLASLSEAYYQASTLEENYCILPEHSLYRVYPRPPGGDSSACTHEVQP
jgi:hypothetical protein